MRVDAALGQLLDQPLSLVKREELGDAHTHEGRRVRVLELLVHLQLIEAMVFVNNVNS